ncbi:hypothetical protein GCM10009628_11630 [Paeniglutamicibacter kerguelensis]
MFARRRLTREFAVAARLRGEGPPAEGWGLSLAAVVAGRREFAGTVHHEPWKDQDIVVIIYVYSAAKTGVPEGIEVHYVNGGRREVEDEAAGIFTDIVWSMDDFIELLACLGNQHIDWYDPVTSFKTARGKSAESLDA